MDRLGASLGDLLVQANKLDIDIAEMRPRFVLYRGSRGAFGEALQDRTESRLLLRELKKHALLRPHLIGQQR